MNPVHGLTSWQIWPSNNAKHAVSLDAEPTFDATKSTINVRVTYKPNNHENRHISPVEKIRAVEVLINGNSRAVRHIQPSESGEIDIPIATNTLSMAERTHPLHIQAKAYSRFDDHSKSNTSIAASKIITFTLPPASTRQISWPSDPIAFTGFAGTSQVSTITIKSSESINKVTFSISSEVGDMLSPGLIHESTLQANTAFNIPLHITIPANKPIGTYKGRIEVREAGVRIASAPVTVIVQNTTANSIPTTVARPTTDRVIRPSGDALRMVKDEVLVGFALDTGNADQRIKEIAAQTQAVIIGTIPDLHMYQLRYNVSNIDQLTAKRDHISKLAQVSFASYNVLADTTKVPFDEKFYPDPPAPSGNPWDNNSHNPRTWGQRYVGLPKAWDTTTGSKSVKIGVIDVGFDFTHPDLRNNILPPDENSRLNSLVSSDAHGTNVAGIICAEGNNDIGIAGVMWHCSLSLYDPGEFSTAGVVDMMLKSAKDNTRVVNMSFGWGSDTKLCNKKPLSIFTKAQVANANTALRQPISWAKSNNKDVLWVFAAGNSCRGVDEVAPGALGHEFAENTMNVAAIQKSENADPKSASEKLTQSNFGADISVAAPGQDIYTTDKPNGYTMQAGTSLAAPYVSGLAGLVLSAHSDFTAAKVKQCITDAANSNGHPVNEHSFKVIDAPEAVRCEKPKPPTGGSNAQCIFEMTNRPESCASTNPTVQANFVNVAGSSACKFESHLRWVASDSSTEFVTQISGLAVGGVLTLGAHTFTTPGDHYILQNVTPLTGGPCIILSSLYRFTLLSPNQ